MPSRRSACAAPEAGPACASARTAAGASAAAPAGAWPAAAASAESGPSAAPAAGATPVAANTAAATARAQPAAAATARTRRAPAAASRRAPAGGRRRGRALWGGLFAAALAGCAAPVFPGRDTGPQAALFRVTEAALDLPAAGAALSRAELAALRALPQRAPDDGVRRLALAAPPEGGARMAAAAAALTAEGVATETRLDPGLAVLRATAPRYAPEPWRCPDWADMRLRHPVDRLFPGPRPHDAFDMGCANDAALEAMLARPTDLTDPPAAEPPARGDAAGRAVERYRTTGPAPLPTRSLSEM